MKRLLKASILTAIVFVAVLLIEVASVFPPPYAGITKIAVVLIVMYLMLWSEDKEKEE